MQPGACFQFYLLSSVRFSDVLEVDLSLLDFGIVPHFIQKSSVLRVVRSSQPLFPQMSQRPRDIFPFQIIFCHPAVSGLAQTFYRTTQALLNCIVQSSPLGGLSYEAPILWAESALERISVLSPSGSYTQLLFDLCSETTFATQQRG